MLGHYTTAPGLISATVVYRQVARRMIPEIRAGVNPRSYQFLRRFRFFFVEAFARPAIMYFSQFSIMRRERCVLFYFLTLSSVVFAGAGMIETNIQKQQQNTISKQPQLEPPLPASEPTVENGLTVTCAICEAVYAPSPPRLPFLQNAQGALEATFISMCHFCFRCRRAACPQCWDEVHGVCGACVQEAKLPFRAEAAPLDGLAFPPRSQQPPTQQQQAASLLFRYVVAAFILKRKPAQMPRPD